MMKATPARLEQLRKDRYWSMQRMTDAIYDRLHVRISMWTLQRTLKGRTRPSEAVQLAFDRFLALEREEDRQETAR